MRIIPINNLYPKMASACRKKEHAGNTEAPEVIKYATPPSYWVNTNIVCFGNQKTTEDNIEILRQTDLLAPEVFKRISVAINKIEKDGKTLQSAGGQFGKVYFSDDIAIKKPNICPFELILGKIILNALDNEAEVMSKLPAEFNGAPKMLAYLKKGNEYYLCSQYVHAPHQLKGNSEETKMFPSLFDHFFTLDESGILHNDLHSENVMHDGKSIFLFDFGNGTLIRPEAQCTEQLPYCNKRNSNAFECKCLEGMYSLHPEEIGGVLVEEEKNIEYFNDYLKAKSKYYTNRAELIKKTADLNIAEAQRAFDYERLCGKFLENPSEDILKLERYMLYLCYFIIKDGDIKEGIEQIIERLSHTADGDMKKYLEFKREMVDYMFAV